MTHGGRPGRAARGAALAALLALAAPAALPAPAPALVRPPTVIDGPSPDVVDLGGVAMAPDGSGGIVYRKRVGGVPHVFAARYANGRWSAPERVDAGQQFASSWPRIAAGDDGKLRVVWVQEFGVDSDRLYAATASAGGGFGTPWLVDKNIGEATATWPTIASNAGGQTYVAYRVLGFTTQVGLPPDGYVAGQIRLARYRGPDWQSLGILARNPATFVRTPSAANAPRISVDSSGDAVVAWQEPDDDFVDRIWARRIFSSGTGAPLLASPQTFGGAPVRGSADAFDLGRGDFGEATVVARVEPPDGAGGAPQLYVDSLPSMFDDASARFAAPRAIGGPTAGLGAPSVSAIGSDWSAAASAGAGVLLSGGDDASADAPAQVGDAGSADAQPVAVAGDDGASVLAWRRTSGAASGVAIRDDDFAGRAQSAVLSAPSGGPVDELDAAGTGLGDALVAFRQGDDAHGAIAVGLVDGPPQPFHVFTPAGWTRPGRARVTWDPASDALDRVRYRLVVDGHRLPGQYGRARLPYRGGLDDGVHRVAVLATDAAGQQTLSATVTLKVDGTPPRVRVTLRGRRLTVRASDGRRGRVAGVAGGGTRVRFG
ncbi:MAG TPA: hypothetical protein VFV85_09420, partial [Conexibacter sp.]|nr:hypothetical protein [Conexibacter sp.]